MPILKEIKKGLHKAEREVNKGLGKIQKEANRLVEDEDDRNLRDAINDGDLERVKQELAQTYPEHLLEDATPYNPYKGFGSHITGKPQNAVTFAFMRAVSGNQNNLDVFREVCNRVEIAGGVDTSSIGLMSYIYVVEANKNIASSKVLPLVASLKSDPLQLLPAFLHQIKYHTMQGDLKPEQAFKHAAAILIAFSGDSSATAAAALTAEQEKLLEDLKNSVNTAMKEMETKYPTYHFTKLPKIVASYKEQTDKSIDTLCTSVCAEAQAQESSAAAASSGSPTPWDSSLVSSLALSSEHIPAPLLAASTSSQAPAAAKLSDSVTLGGSTETAGGPSEVAVPGLASGHEESATTVHHDVSQAD
jgi:hypothetical protein